MKSIWSGVVVIFMFILVFTSLSLIGSEQEFSSLDSKSQNVLLSIDDTLDDDLNTQDLVEEEQDNLTHDPDNTVFGFEFLTAQSDAKKKISVISTVKNSPEIVLASTGVETEPFQPFVTAAKWFIAILISLITFDAIFTRRVFNK